MVICVEGNVHVGKTTYIKKFLSENLDYVLVEESKLKKDLKPYERQLDYIRQEKHKKATFINNDNLIMDRSILSVYIYTMLTNELNEKEKQSLFDIIKDCVSHREVLIPDEMIFISLPYEKVISNQLKLAKEKGTQPALAEKEYYGKYNEFFIKQIKDGQEKSIGDRVIIEFDPKNIFFNLKFDPNLNIYVSL